MARSVTFSVVPRRNPRNPDAAPQYYAQAQARGVVSLTEMSERIEKECTLTKADIYAALVALEGTIITALSNGEIVQLGELGSMQVGLNGKGAVDEKMYEMNLIKKAHVNFRSGLGLRKMLTGLVYTRVKKKSGIGVDPAPQAPDPLPME